MPEPRRLHPINVKHDNFATLFVTSHVMPTAICNRYAGTGTSLSIAERTNYSLPLSFNPAISSRFSAISKYQAAVLKYMEERVELPRWNPCPSIVKR